VSTYLGRLIFPYSIHGRLTGDVRVIYGCDPYITRTSPTNHRSIVKEGSKKKAGT